MNPNPDAVPKEVGDLFTKRITKLIGTTRQTARLSQ